MLSMTGVVTIVQEGRFQLLDDDGVAHHFLLKWSAASEPEQLPDLLNQRVRVSYTSSDDLIGHAALGILLEEA
jgi:hypothetical protein